MDDIKNVEIGCDESGAEGENVANARDDMVFAHGSTDLEVDIAERLIQELRDRTRTQAPELKSESLLKPSTRKTLNWALSEDSPLAGRGAIALIDKQYFLVSKMVDLLVEELAYERGEDLYTDRKARDLAWGLYREGRRDLGPDLWACLLGVFNSVMRMKQRSGTKATVDEFFSVVGQARRKSHRRNVLKVLDLVDETRKHAEAFQHYILNEPDSVPSLDPMAAAIPMTARHWYERTRAEVVLVHDRQHMLTTTRANEMIRVLNQPAPEFRHLVGKVKLQAIYQVDSKDDARVQVADILAGAGRWAARQALIKGDEDAAELVRPYINVESVWADKVTYRMLTGRPEPGK